MQPEHQQRHTSGERIRGLLRRWWWLIAAAIIVLFPICSWSFALTQLSSREDASTHYNLGLTYYGQRDLDEAITEFDEAIRLNTRFAEAYGSRGLAHFDKGNLDQALLDYDRAIELRPDMAAAYYNRALVYQVSISDPIAQEKARADIRKVLELTDDQELRTLAESKLRELGGK